MKEAQSCIRPLETDLYRERDRESHRGEYKRGVCQVLWQEKYNTFVRVSLEIERVCWCFGDEGLNKWT